jgi:uroporphyrin-III C-methyltransferase
MSTDRAGTVYLVGAGPGAADLLTVRAVHLLEAADIVFHDALVSDEVLALATRADKVAVGKRCGRHSTAQRFIEKRLVDAAATSRIVVRLKGGDPNVFGRADEELIALRRAGVRVEIVPGITAALAAAAALGVPLTRRGDARSMVLVTARHGDGPSYWARSAAACDAGVIYMGSLDASATARALIGAGKPASTPVAIVSRASLHDERCEWTTLGALRAKAAAIATPALLLFGPQFAVGSDARANASREHTA